VPIWKLRSANQNEFTTGYETAPNPERKARRDSDTPIQGRWQVSQLWNHELDANGEKFVVSEEFMVWCTQLGTFRSGADEYEGGAMSSQSSMLISKLHSDDDLAQATDELLETLIP
jgi:hypothetical protein